MAPMGVSGAAILQLLEMIAPGHSPDVYYEWVNPLSLFLIHGLPSLFLFGLSLRRRRWAVAGGILAGFVILFVLIILVLVGGWG